MSCSGQHFSVHSPDCKAHMNIQSNRPIQVEPIASSSSVTPLDSMTRYSPHEHQVHNMSNLQQQQQQQQLGAPARAWGSTSPAEGRQVWPPARSSPNQAHSPAQILQIQAYQDGQVATSTRCPSGELIDIGSNNENDENNYTLVILDCSPHPASDSESRNYRDSASQAGTLASTTMNCELGCRCQTELIIRQQFEHDHTCQFAGQPQQQQQQQFYGTTSGALNTDSLANQARLAQVQETTISTRQQQDQFGGARRPLQQIQEAPINQYQHQQPQQQQRQPHPSTMQQYQVQEDNNWENYQQQQASKKAAPSPDNKVGQWNEARQVEQQHQRQLNDEQRETTTKITEITTTTTMSTANEGGQQQENSASPDKRDRSPAAPLKPRPGTRIVKRWNWNQAQFVEEEVPDRPQARPQPAADEPSSSSRQIYASNSRPPPQHLTASGAVSGGGAPNAWNQELQELSSELSPVPPRDQYDPSWLAYRQPDEQSVQADPLYRDLMMELRILEEGVTSEQQRAQGQQARSVEPIVTPDCQQKPAFGQPLLPDSIELNEYENVEFIGRLIPNSDPTMRVEWIKNGRPLLESSRLTSEYEFGVVRLCIRRCEAEDSGIYQCRAINALGETVSRAKLLVHAKGNIQYETLHPAGLDKIRQLENPKQVEHVEEPSLQQPPKFLTHIQDYVERNEGDSVHFECCLGPVDDPDLRTEWFFNGRPLVTGSRFHTIDDFGFIVLDIDWLYPRDTGEYICRATNKWGSDFTRTVMRVRPAKNIILDSQLAENADATIDKLRQLEFPDVPGEVYVEEPGKPAHFVQPLRSAANKSQFNEGDNVHFEARVGPASDGELTVEWFHNERPLISGHRFKPTFDFGHILLDILYVYPEDSGVYKCVARNKLGVDVSEFEINVTGKPGLVYQSQLPKEMEGGVQKITDMEAMWNRAPDPEEEEEPAKRTAPEFVLEPKPCTAFEGSCARFCCRILAHPRPRVAWFINDQLVVNGLRYKLTYDGMYHLIVPKCTLQDAGRVRVVARNLLGECSSETELKVKRKVDDYRGVLKNSPNPWYDEQTLRVYRRQRNQGDDDELNDSEDYEEFLANFQKQQWLRQQQQQQQQNQLQVAAEYQTTSPLANQVIGYMEPGTPDVNLLAMSSNKSPLVEPGDLHPVVLEQQAIMAPAPSTVQRALEHRTNDKSLNTIPSTPNDNIRKSFFTSDNSHDNNNFDGASGNIESDSNRQHQQDLSSSSASQSSAAVSSAAAVAATSASAGDFDNQNQKRIFGLTTSRSAANQQWADSQSGGQVSGSGHQRGDNQQQQRQQHLRVTFATPPPASPESVEHGKEIHSHFHKQLQVERRPNKEITREIIEKETFEQEHKGFSKDNLVVMDREQSQERALRGVTPTRQDQQQQQQQQQTEVRIQTITTQTATPKSSRQQATMGSQQQQQSYQQQQQQQVIIEDYMIPPEFVQKIQPCQAIDGDEARFECIFKGDPEPTITWYRENKLIKPSNLYKIETDLSEHKSILVIRRVTLNGNAVYTVKAENVAGSAKSSANLVVEPHPLPGASRSGGQARQFDAMDHLSAHQYAHLSDVRGFGDGSLSPISESTDRGSSSTTLIDDPANLRQTSQEQLQQQQQHQKVVKSVRTRRLSPDEMSSLLRASPDNLVAPTFLHTLNEVHVKPGELARLDARLIGSLPIEVRWLKDGQRVRADKQHKLLLEGDLYTLLILESAPSDAGFYECVAANAVGEARCGAPLRVSPDGRHSAGSSSSMSYSQFSQQQLLPVATSSSSQYSASSSSLTPSSHQGAASQSSRQQGQSNLSSSSQQQQQHQQQQQQQQQQPRLHFGMTNKPHHQLMSEYSSSSSTMTQDGHLQQQHQLIPKLIKGLESQQVREGKSVTLRCQISAHPKAEISWFKHGDKLIKPSKYFRIFKDNDETHCLKILETFAEDQGQYKCVARAQNGQIETSATITVVPNSPR